MTRLVIDGWRERKNAAMLLDIAAENLSLSLRSRKDLWSLVVRAKADACDVYFSYKSHSESLVT